MKYRNLKENEQEPIRENFCGACVAIPLALTGIGISASSGVGSYQKNKKIMLYVGLGITIISVLFAVYFLYIKKCTDCR